MQSTDLTIDMVTDNGDNSLTIVGHDTDSNSYTTSMGRMSDLPADKTEQTPYYQQILFNSLPPTQAVLYQAPGYTPPEDDNGEDDDESARSPK